MVSPSTVSSIGLNAERFRGVTSRFDPGILCRGRVEEICINDPAGVLSKVANVT